MFEDQEITPQTGEFGYQSQLLQLQKDRKRIDDATREVSDAEQSYSDFTDPTKNADLNAIYNPKVSGKRKAFAAILGGMAGMADPRFYRPQEMAQGIGYAIMGGPQRDRNMESFQQQAAARKSALGSKEKTLDNLRKSYELGSNDLYRTSQIDATQARKAADEAQYKEAMARIGLTQAQIDDMKRKGKLFNAQDGSLWQLNDKGGWDKIYDGQKPEQFHGHDAEGEVLMLGDRGTVKHTGIRPLPRPDSAVGALVKDASEKSANRVYASAWDNGATTFAEAHANLTEKAKGARTDEERAAYGAAMKILKDEETRMKKGGGNVDLLLNTINGPTSSPQQQGTPKPPPQRQQSAPTGMVRYVVTGGGKDGKTVYETSPDQLNALVKKYPNMKFTRVN